MPSRLTGSIPFIATVLIAALSVGTSTSTARAKDCLAAPNSPAPEGSWWYYRLDWPTQRKCWYLRALGKPAQQTSERATTGSGQPVRPKSAPSESTRPTDRAFESVTTDDSAPSPPDAETAPVGSIVPEVPAPQASTSWQTGAPTAPPTQSDAPVISATIQQAHDDNSAPSPPDAETAPVGSIVPEVPAPQASTSWQTGAPTAPPTQSDAPVISATIQRAHDDNSAPSPPDAHAAPVGSIAPEVPAPQASTSWPTSVPTMPRTQSNAPVISATIQQSAHEESATNSVLERPVGKISASSKTNSEAAAPVDAGDVASPDAVPRIKALESNAVSTDAPAASVPDYIERVVRSREQANNEQAPISFFVIAVGLVVIGISFHFVRRARIRASSLNHS